MSAVSSIHLMHRHDLQVVQQFVADTEQQYLLLNLYSTKGIGKTTFLVELKEKLSVQYPTAFVRVQDFISESKEDAYRLDRLLFALFDQLQAYSTASQVAVGHQETPMIDVEGVTEKITELVYNFTKVGITPLILIDDYDRLLTGPRTIFESVVLSKILAHPNYAKVILSSEQELQFTSRFDLRIRLKTHKLEYLTEEDIQHSVPQYAELASEIRVWTGGMPDLVGFFVAEAKKRQIDSLEEYRARSQEIFGPTYRKQIQDVVFADVRIVSEHALDVLAILRRFDVAILSEVLPKVYPETFASFKQKHYLDLIRELGSRVSWQKQGGYVLDQMLRIMLFSYAKTFEPTLYQQVNYIATTIYETWLKEDYRPHYVSEMIYHQMLFEQLAGNDTTLITEHLKSKLFNSLRTWRGTLPDRKEKMNHLQELLGKDDDLRQFLSQEALGKLFMQMSHDQ